MIEKPSKDNRLNHEGHGAHGEEQNRQKTVWCDTLRWVART